MERNKTLNDKSTPGNGAGKRWIAEPLNWEVVKELTLVIKVNPPSPTPSKISPPNLQ